MPCELEPDVRSMVEAIFQNEGRNRRCPLAKSLKFLSNNASQNYEIKMDKENVSLPGIEDILDLTDTEDSTSSSNQAIFDVQEPFVLELHDLIKDQPGPDSVEPEANLNVKKHKKKKKSLSPHIKRNPSESSISISEVSSAVASVDEPSKEEYFDAHESYHTMPEYTVSTPMTGTSLMQTHSENVPNPKAAQTTITQRPPAPSRDPSTAIDKPVTPPE